MAHFIQKYAADASLPAAVREALTELVSMREIEESEHSLLQEKEMLLKEKERMLVRKAALLSESQRLLKIKELVLRMKSAEAHGDEPTLEVAQKVLASQSPSFKSAGNGSFRKLMREYEDVYMELAKSQTNVNTTEVWEVVKNKNPQLYQSALNQVGGDVSVVKETIEWLSTI